MIAELADALHLDLETRSRINLNKTGPYVYGEDWSTSVWCACFARGDGDVQAWHPGDPLPDVVVQAEYDGVPWVAHNSGFERALLTTQLVPKFGWPCPPRDRWYCTASMAAALALPRNLEGAAKVLGCSMQKDMEGHELMKKMMKPLKTVSVPCLLCSQLLCEHDEQHKLRLVWHETPDAIARGTDYCKQDVLTERALCDKLRALSPDERRIWLLDQKMNERGVRIDIPTVKKSLVVVRDSMAELNQQMVELTGGLLATQVQKLRWWMTFEGFDPKNLRKDTVRDLLIDEEALDAGVRQALELRQEAAKSSTSKLNAYLARVGADGRMRDNLVYHAAHTGRWAGRGAQLQNMPSRFNIEEDVIATGLELVEEGFDASWIRHLTDCNPLALVSANLKKMVIPGEGKRLVWADYNAVEGRGTAWLTGAKGLLGVFERDEDPYLYQASDIYKIPLSTMSKATHPRERQLGKIAVLSLGYQTGAEKFISTAWKERIPLTRAESQKIVTSFRELNHEIPTGWKILEDGAFQAVKEPGRMVLLFDGKIVFLREGSWLYMRLPSGHILFYPGPAIGKRQMPWIDDSTGKPAEKWGVTYLGVDGLTHKWCKQYAYGGRWMENAVQGMCRDKLAHGMLRLDDAGYDLVLSVHDSAVAEVDEGFGSVGEFIRIMCAPDEWAPGFPVKAEGGEGRRLEK